MTHDELNQNFDTLRKVIAEEMARPQNQSDEAQKMAGFVLLGIGLLQIAFGDLKRIADAAESLAGE